MCSSTEERERKEKEGGKGYVCAFFIVLYILHQGKNLESEVAAEFGLAFPNRAVG